MDEVGAMTEALEAEVAKTPGAKLESVFERAVLGAVMVTSSGLTVLTVLTGDLGVSASPAVVRVPSGDRARCDPAPSDLS